ncbi:MAG: response regulator [Gammaproteobacteria bacterium]|nr:response regulator [Gammaproteobacteria bacterium]MBU1482322.1 response regulator [Gammaproteobacteria bacterium]
MKRHGIERQTLAVAVIPILILALLLESYFTYTRFADLDRALFDRAKLIVHQLASSSEYPVFSGNQGLLQQQVDAAFAQQDVNSILVLDADLKYLAGAGGTRNTYERELFKNSLSEVDDIVTIREDRNVLWFHQPIVATQIKLDELANATADNLSSKALGSVIVEISKSRLNIAKLEMLGLNLFLLLLVLLSTMLIAMRVSRRITLPVLQMNNAIRRIGEGHLDTHIAGNRVLELDELASGINDMSRLLQQDRNTLQQRIDEATQELRRKKEEAEKANYDKSRFLAAASHDLRQPMHALGLFVGELHSRLDTAEQLKIASKVEESVEALSSLLDSLLDISKLDAGIVIPQIQGVDVESMLKRMVQDFVAVAQRKNITLRVRCFHAKVLSDPVLLERILLNLLSNAIRYTPQNGTVLLCCRKRGDDLRIEVRDNGVGIPPTEQQNVFHEFVQLANSARDRSKGLGLGLAIVDRLARLLRHSLTLRSSPNRGSTFSVTVPREFGVEELLAEQGNVPVAAPSRHDRMENLQALVVDDDMLVRISTAGILESWGCHVMVAGDLQESKELCSQIHFDLVICDYRLPDGNGLMLADFIQENREIQPAIILVSGDTAPEIQQASIARGLHLMYKPVRPAKLRSLVIFLLKKRDELD